MHKGSCLCGAVRFEIEGEIETVLKCHCQKCRKASGTAFGTNAPIQSSAFRLVDGADALASYQSTPDLARYFCRNCGSPIYSQRTSTPELKRLRVGSLDTPLKARPSAHIYVGSKAEWDEILDTLPQHAEQR